MTIPTISALGALILFTGVLDVVVAWPWINQWGATDRYDWLENIGCDVHSTDRILPKFQTSL